MVNGKIKEQKGQIWYGSMFTTVDKNENAFYRALGIHLCNNNNNNKFS